MNKGKLDGKVALVTGGNSGMGLATARLFAQEGATVIVTGRRQKEVDEAVASIGSSAEGVQGDISNFADLDRLRNHIATKHGRLDVLFANAGFGAMVPLGKVTEEQFDQEFDVNVKGTFFTVQKLLDLIPDGGSIILNGSIASHKGMPAFTVYSATKAALRSFARTWTTDLKDRKIRVNVLSPGHIETPIFSKVGLNETELQAFRESSSATVPLGRLGHVDEIARAVLFLASDDSSYVAGTELTVDGGFSMV